MSAALALVPALVTPADDEAEAAPSTKMLDAALHYASEGFKVFPCHSARDGRCSCGNTSCSVAKHPRVSGGFNEATDDAAQITKWWGRWPEANIGIRTGAVSGIVCFDFDHAVGRALAEQIKTLPTPIADTGGEGVHMVFAHPGYHVSSRRGVVEGLDVRGDGGYIIAPPSVHASGKRYAWRQYFSPDDTDPAPIPESLQPYILATLVAATTPGEPDADTRPDAPPADVERARGYIAKRPAAVSGNGGHDAAFRVALDATKGFSLSYSQALALLREYNCRCVPPWSEKELAHKLRSAMKSTRVPEGYIVKSRPRAALARPAGSESWILEMVVRPAGAADRAEHRDRSSE